jgi:hypothetical protein
MLLASVVILSGSLGRMPYVINLALLPPLYVYGPSLLFAGLLLLLHWGMTRLPSRSYLLGYGGLVVASFVFVALGNSALWLRLTAPLVR